MVERAFTAQAEGFNASPVMNARAVLDLLVQFAAPAATDAWLEMACGPGIVSRALAPLVREVRGIDLTPAMVELARAEAARAGISNVTFEVGDATATVLDADSVDGAINRVSLHHIPVPGRLIAEMSRVVRPGGRVVVGDHLGDEARDDFAWSQAVERLRDPSHWASLTLSELHDLGASAGLTLIDERVIPLTLDFDEWLQRGTSDLDAHALIEDLIGRRPAGTDRFRLRERDGARMLELQMWIGAWRTVSG